MEAHKGHYLVVLPLGLLEENIVAQGEDEDVLPVHQVPAGVHEDDGAGAQGRLHALPGRRQAEHVADAGLQVDPDPLDAEGQEEDQGHPSLRENRCPRLN